MRGEGKMGKNNDRTSLGARCWVAGVESNNVWPVAERWEFFYVGPSDDALSTYNMN